MGGPPTPPPRGGNFKARVDVDSQPNSVRFVWGGVRLGDVVRECWRFYAVPTARVIFMAKTSVDVFSLSREQVWTFSVSGHRIYEMRCLFQAANLGKKIHWPGWQFA